MTQEEINEQIELDELEDLLWEYSDECENCGGLYRNSDLNEYGLCLDCEEELQDEKKAIQETQDSLQNFR